MVKNIFFIILAGVLFTGQVFAEAAAGAKDPGSAVKQSKENVKTEKPENALDKVSKEDLLERVNGILSHNPQILETLPEIQKETKDNKTIFKVGGKEMESFSKDELMVVLKKISPALLKIQQERIRKQQDQIMRQHQQNMQIQNMAQQQSQMKPPAVYTPPAQQPSVQTPYRPPAGSQGPPRH